VLQQLVDLGAEHVEAHHVGQAHASAGEHRLEVVEGEGELGGHVTGVLRPAVGVGGGLAGADEHALLPLDELGLVEPEAERPGRRVDRCTVHDASFGWCGSS
jgi:hypothetical protein